MSPNVVHPGEGVAVGARRVYREPKGIGIMTIDENGICWRQKDIMLEEALEEHRKRKIPLLMAGNNLKAWDTDDIARSMSRRLVILPFKRTSRMRECIQAVRGYVLENFFGRRNRPSYTGTLSPLWGNVKGHVEMVEID